MFISGIFGGGCKAIYVGWCVAYKQRCTHRGPLQLGVSQNEEIKNVSLLLVDPSTRFALVVVMKSEHKG